MFKYSLWAGRFFFLFNCSVCLYLAKIYMYISFSQTFLCAHIHGKNYTDSHKARENASTLSGYERLPMHMHIQTRYWTSDELLPTRDKSPPACGISAGAHVGARPDPTASALSPTTWGSAWETDWLTDGRSAPDKRLEWLITEAHLSTRGGPWCANDCGPNEGEPPPGSSTWHPEADSPAHGRVWSSVVMCSHVT